MRGPVRDDQLTSLSFFHCVLPFEATGASNLREGKGRKEARVEDLVPVPGSSQSWMVREREAWRQGWRLLGGGQ